jgi:phage tail-like protein
VAQNPFTADVGTYQGRIASPSAVQGSYVYELGHALPGQLFTFNPGDAHEITQTADVTDVRAVRATIITRGATTMPAGATWSVQLKVDGNVVASRTLDQRSIVLVDLAANLHGAGLSGDHDISFALVIAGGTGPYEAELPGCAVDAVVADDTGVVLELVNRNPQPDETNVAVGGPFEVHVESSLGSDDPDLAQTTITVDGEVVCLDGVFQAGWTSSGVATTWSDGLAFSLLPDEPLAPSAAHVVEVTSALVGGPAASLIQGWTFSTVDTVAPSVTGALAIRDKEVRVTFSEEMTSGDGTTEADVLNPANYTFTLLGGWPAVTPTVVSVAADGATQVVLTLDISMTRRATYQVTVENAEDLNDNALTPPSNTAIFIGYSFPVPSDRDFDLYTKWVTEDLRTQDAQQRPGEDGDLKVLFAIWQEPLDLLLGVIDKIHENYDPDLAPEAFVDLMLWENGNPFNFPMTLIEKRRLVQILIDIYRSKGTGPGIVDAIRLFMGIEVTLNVYAWSPVGLGEAIMGETWILGSSDPQDLLTFQVLVPQVLTDAERTKMSQIIDYMMDAREFFVILEPEEIVVPDHWQMGYSQLGINTILH